MRINQVRVQHFRSIKDITVGCGALTAIVGSGGTGKSSFLRAIEWFFRGGPLDPDDIFMAGGTGDAPEDEVAVTVTFSELNTGDRAALGRYGAGDPTTFTRTWSVEAGEKLSGSALFLAEFDPVRALAGVQRRQAYKELVDGSSLRLPSPAPTRVAEVDMAMESYERENPARCELRSGDASHLFGFAGGPKLTDRFDYVLVGATDDAVTALGDARDSVLSRLLSSLDQLDAGTQEKVEQLQARAQGELRELITNARASGLREIAEGITRRVREYVPQASVELTDTLGPPRPPDVSVAARVRDEIGHSTDVERQGHGLQRALVIALLHELAERTAAPDEEAVTPPSQRSLMLAIEEPELYQHPLQARSLARTLRALAVLADEAVRRSIQIAYSTHSAHFVRPALYEDLRVFRRGADGATVDVEADPDAVATELAEADIIIDVAPLIEKTLSRSLAEAVFARAVLLCEGSTDAAVMTAVAQLDGGFDRDGIAVVTCWGKTVIPVALAILRQLKIPTFVLFDADAGLAERLAHKTSMGDAERRVQLDRAAEKNRQLLSLCGEPAEDWPARVVRQGCANFADRLESDLEEIWPDLTEARLRFAAELGMSPKVDEAYVRAIDELANPPSFLRDVVIAMRALVAAQPQTSGQQPGTPQDQREATQP